MTKHLTKRKITIKKYPKAEAKNQNTFKNNATHNPLKAYKPENSHPTNHMLNNFNF